MRNWRPTRRATLTTALAVIALGVAGVAYADTPQPAIKTFTPRHAEQITNIDVLRQQIRNYYGDPLNSGTFADDSNYAKEARSVAESGTRWLNSQAHGYSHTTQAILLDVDDTSLATWNYEVFSNWAVSYTHL